MGKYGKTAKLAALLLINRHESEPRSAWHRAAADVFSNSPSSRDKACPRDSFLALCGAGAIKDVPIGNYTCSVKNSGYVLRALTAVRATPSLIHDEKELWCIATNNADIRPNYQVEVLIALWSAGLIQDAF